MSLPVKEIISMIVDNTIKRNSPVPVPKNIAYGWIRNLDIPKEGETILYTGLLYQLSPYIDALVKYIEKFGKKGNIFLRTGVVLNKFINVSKFIARPSKQDVARQNEILWKIGKLLKSMKIKYGYLYEDELYSGVLLYDLGIEDAFLSHAEKVYSVFREHNVKRIITIDPHTTHIVRTIYPKYIPEFDIQVKNYLEILYELDPKPKKLLNTKIVIHDPCFYTRYENIIEPQRKLLERAGVQILEPRRTRELTFCCGGPVESLSPSMAKKIAEIRINQLKTKNYNILVMCPLCYANLRRVASEDINLIDISQLLYDAYTIS